eukprot:3685562-Lingulodinium_polyedra.AAC.1
MTCDTGHATSVIDFMVASSEISKAHRHDQVNMQWVPKPHRPFEVCFCRKAKEARQLVFRQAKALPLEPVIGPKLPGPSWDVALQIGHRALEECAGQDHAAAKELLNLAWKHLANTAEEELALVTDQQVLSKGLRATPPTAHWVKVFKGNRTAEDREEIHDGWAWLLAT